MITATLHYYSERCLDSFSLLLFSPPFASTESYLTAIQRVVRVVLRVGGVMEEGEHTSILGWGGGARRCQIVTGLVGK